MANDLTCYSDLSQKLGISQDQAAWRCGLSTAAFRWLVEKGKMPKPVNVRKRLVWYRPDVDAAFAEMMGAARIEEAEDEWV